MYKKGPTENLRGRKCPELRSTHFYRFRQGRGWGIAIGAGAFGPSFACLDRKRGNTSGYEEQRMEKLEQFREEQNCSFFYVLKAPHTVVVTSFKTPGVLARPVN